MNLDLDSQKENNPLLMGLHPKVTYGEIPFLLAHNPLSNLDLSKISSSEREELLHLHKRFFVPTATAVEIFSALQTLHREGYIQRNPSQFEKRNRLFEIANLRGQSFATIPWFQSTASGILIKGITGLGKSTIVDRYLLLQPKQVILHTDGAIPGFTFLTQISWLKVQMSADGSRAGFLLSILSEIDKVAGTNYFSQYNGRKTTIEKLLVMVGIILSSHYVGILVVEEIQEHNFNSSQWSHEIATFFLRLLNFGIPVVLVGNSLGFKKLLENSQITRRLTTSGSFNLTPFLDHTNITWSKIIVPQIWNFNVMPKQTELTDKLIELLHRLTGGVMDFLLKIIVEAQRIALRLDHKSINEEHLKAAYEGPIFTENRDLIRGLADKDLMRLTKVNDVPLDEFAEIWEDAGSIITNKNDGNRTDFNPFLATDKETIPKRSNVDKQRAQYKSAQTRKESNRIKNAKIIDGLLDEDERNKRGIGQLLDGLNAIKTKKEGGHTG